MRTDRAYYTSWNIQISAPKSCRARGQWTHGNGCVSQPWLTLRVAYRMLSMRATLRAHNPGTESKAIGINLIGEKLYLYPVRDCGFVLAGHWSSALWGIDLFSTLKGGTLWVVLRVQSFISKKMFKIMWTLEFFLQKCYVVIWYVWFAADFLQTFNS